jgi:hypothetical protein
MGRAETHKSIIEKMALLGDHYLSYIVISKFVNQMILLCFPLKSTAYRLPDRPQMILRGLFEKHQHKAFRNRPQHTWQIVYNKGDTLSESGN